MGNSTHHKVTSSCSVPIFSSLDELISDQGDVAVIIDEDPDRPGHFYISVYKTLRHFTSALAGDPVIYYRRDKPLQ